MCRDIGIVVLPHEWHFCFYQALDRCSVKPLILVSICRSLLAHNVRMTIAVDLGLYSQDELFFQEVVG